MTDAAWLTVRVRDEATVLLSAESAGVKVALSDCKPACGAVDGVVHAKVPGIEAVPPVRVDEARVWPKVMALAVGHADTVGAALFTVTVTVPITVLLSVVSVGVNVTLSDCEPACGAVDGVVHANVPAIEAAPPVSVDEARVWPKVMVLAVGHVETVGVPLITVIVT